MTTTSPTEKLVEDVASVYFSALGISTRRGVEIDDAGERGDAAQCILQGRLEAVLRRLNPVLPHDALEEVVRTISRPTASDAHPEQPLVPHHAHRRRRG